MGIRDNELPVLAPGGTGLIGAHIARGLLLAGIQPVLFDSLPRDENIEGIAASVIVSVAMSAIWASAGM